MAKRRKKHLLGAASTGQAVAWLAGIFGVAAVGVYALVKGGH